MHFRLFSTDLDGTVLGDSLSSARFSLAWAGLNRGIRPLLVYNTGRSVADTRALIAAQDLVRPDYIIGGLGTEFFDLLYHRVPDPPAAPPARWDLSTVEHVIASFPEIKSQPTGHPNPFKSSWFWECASRAAVEELKSRLRLTGMETHVAYSCRYFLDVVPASAGKGNALSLLCQRLRIPLQGVLVAGDTANDTSMFRLNGVRGIVVQNALPELISEVIDLLPYVSSSPMAEGVIEGLRYFGVIPDQSVPSAPGTKSISSALP
jgi:sucrose-6F-phosphate phosphohydrolase